MIGVLLETELTLDILELTLQMLDSLLAMLEAAFLDLARGEYFRSLEPLIFRSVRKAIFGAP